MTRAWNRFWFEPEPTSTLALVRIAFGLVVLGWTVALLPDFFAWFGADGILPRQPGGIAGWWGPLGPDAPDGVLVGVLIALLVSAACLVVGYRTRLAAVLVFLGLLAFERRDPWVFDSGDGLLRVIALYLALAPSGAALSLDRARRARERFWEFPARAPWALRLMQVQLSVIYLATVWTKLRGTTWNDGTAVSYALRVGDLERFPLPHFVTDSVLIANLMTYGTLAIELAIGVLVWNRRARPWVLGLGVALHLGIEYSMRVGFFTVGMLVLYLAFVPPDTASRAVLAVRDRARPRRVRQPA
ncbi:MAG TPA: HTTM domain-containing protein [Thermoleophilaceae bacterium]|nr:HTTM domain-containing protein [Thermoleophilaceae bacterium]